MTGTFGKIAIAAAASTILGSCASIVQAVGDTQDTRILNADTVQGERKPSAFETIQKKASSADGAAPRLRGQDSCLPIKAQDNSAAGDAVSANLKNGKENFSFFCKQAKSELDVNDSNNAKLYLAAGLTLSNELCTDWFNKLYVTQITLRQSADMISNLGSLTVAIESLTHSPTRASGITAALFGAGKQSLDTLATNYIVAADLPTVASAVREYRALYAREIDQAQTSWNYYTARRVIEAYDNTCSALAVKTFVNTRVSGATADKGVQPLLDAAINAFAADTKYFEKGVTPAQLVDIYAFAILKDTPQPIRDKLLEGLKKEQLTTPAGGIKFKGAFTANDLANGILQANIDSALKIRATARVDALRDQLAADAKAKSADLDQKSKVAAAAATDAAQAKQAQANKQAAVDNAQRKLDLAQQALATAKAAEIAAKSAAAGAAAEVKQADQARIEIESAKAVAGANATDDQKKQADAASRRMDSAVSANATAAAAVKQTELASQQAATDVSTAKGELAKAQSDLDAAKIATSAAEAKTVQAASDLSTSSTVAAAAAAAATGSARQQADSLNALNAVTPLGPNGRPLDTPPPP